MTIFESRIANTGKVKDINACKDQGKLKAWKSSVLSNYNLKKTSLQAWGWVETASLTPGHILYIIKICLHVTFCSRMINLRKDGKWISFSNLKKNYLNPIISQW